MSDRSPVVLGSKIPHGLGSLEGAEPPYDEGRIHGRVGPQIAGQPGAWQVVPGEAPIDGKIYARQDEEWVEGGGGVPEVTNIRHPYGRMRENVGIPATWERVVEEAQEDNRTYGRENGVWVPITMIGDSPNDGITYGRRSGQWVLVAPEVPAANPNFGSTYGRDASGWQQVPTDLPDAVPNLAVFGRQRSGTVRFWQPVTEEAPLDSTLRGRQNGQWVPIATPTPGIPEAPIAPTFGWSYGRQQGNWQPVPTDIPDTSPQTLLLTRTQLGSSKAWVPAPIQQDAAQDNNVYARHMGDWIEVPEEAPNDTQNYTRRFHQWIPTPIQTDAPNDGQLYARNGTGRSWQVTVSRAPNTGGPFLRSSTDWVDFATPWQTITLTDPGEWVGGTTQLQGRTVGDKLLELIGTLYHITLITPGADGTDLLVCDLPPALTPNVAIQIYPVYAQNTQGNPDIIPIPFILIGATPPGSGSIRIQVPSARVGGMPVNIFQGIHIMAALK
ncbi:MAG TPA: hypothetical protein VNZ45_01685 [Bacteroidia bacterium]|nr:hypothetical protein [Bacteroidia bacterium]